MKKNNEQNVFTTLDAYLFGYLTLKGFIPRLIEQGDKVVFHFDASGELYKAISEYNSSAKVEALKLTCVTNYEVSPFNVIVQQGATFNLIVGDAIYKKEHNSIWKKIKKYFEIIERLIFVIRVIIGLLRTL